MNGQTLELLDDPETFVRRVAEQVLAERQAEPPAPEGFMSVKSAAQFLDVSEETIRAWLKKGLIPKYKAGRATRVKIGDLIRPE